MQHNVKVRFNLQKRRPQILLIGNGIIRTKASFSWDDFLDKFADDSIDVDKKVGIKLGKNIPYSLKSDVLTSIEDVKRRKKYTEILTNENSNKNYEKQKDNELIKELLKIESDAILTTNYTYEFENALLDDYYLKNNDFKCRFACDTIAHQAKNSYKDIKTFNRFDYNGSIKDIWHIHGEERKKSSLVFTHDEYIRLIGNIINYNRENANRYQTEQADLVINSWVDYFIVADVYILGLGLDYSEVDLWWLLTRRLREKSGYGKIHYYEPLVTNDESKRKLIQAYDIEYHDCGCVIDDNKKDYVDFYKKAIKDISGKIKEVKGR